MLHNRVRHDRVIFSRCSHAHQTPSLAFMTFPIFLHVRGTPNLFIFSLFADAETVCPAFITMCYGIAIR
jgi:hypothetical protein